MDRESINPPPIRRSTRPSHIMGSIMESGTGEA
jgi:hypothetical protein